MYDYIVFDSMHGAVELEEKLNELGSQDYHIVANYQVNIGDSLARPRTAMRFILVRINE